MAANVEHVSCDVFQGAFDFAGGRRYGSKDHAKAKEQADYNLKYLVAVALGQSGTCPGDPSHNCRLMTYMPTWRRSPTSPTCEEVRCLISRREVARDE